MLFSIIIPFKETNIKYVKDCIESLEEQTFKDFEVLLVHNRTDQLPSLLKDSSLNYRPIPMDNPSNVSGLRNKGLLETEGDYVLFLDSDDYLHPNAFMYAKKIIDTESPEAIRLKINTTHFDKKTSFDKNNQAFYKTNTLETLNQVFNKLSIDITSKQGETLINELFEENVLNFNYNERQPEQIMKRLNRPLKVHGFVFQRNFLIENNISFDETLDLYGEIPFLMKIYHRIPSILETTVGLYYKLIHNDPINYPSLSQEFFSDRSFQFFRALKIVLQDSDNLDIARQVKQRAIKHYLYTIIKNEEFLESFERNIPLYHELQAIFLTESAPVKLANRHRMEISSISRGNFRIAYFTSKARVIGYTVYQFSQPKKKRFRQKLLQEYIFSKLPIQENIIIYESFLGRNYSDSPKAIFKHLLKQQTHKKKHIWVLNDKDMVKDEAEFHHKDVKVIKRFSWKYFYYVTVAKYFVLNMRQPKWLHKKPEQIILSTWHGTPLKKLVFDMDNVASANPIIKKISISNREIGII
ncbi:CDP-glycerol glycerophosphotransferase family protein [Gracilibacillus alcaliphilus]|uniref:CDP-glycerol glycerophosphotransferase family protein n=1 Tax=Gracilibacillus alcaliphilus TaxID=1401441 RepID=UPI0023BACDC6|nr:CDP-glycerol glycerophosphotransferase family protein [Gracilibacillus alcaliphilus]MBM7678430.1 glycosyltransferase involved in cell wall biosynthesis [Gracilibacillus alcaliphilus]